MIRRAIWLFTATLAVAGAGCGSAPVASTPKSAPTAAPPPPTQTSSSRTNYPGDILSVLSVEHQVDVAAQRDGVLVSIAADEGKLVKAGDILGQIDDRNVQMEIIKARDDLVVAQNNVKYKEAELRAKGAAYKRQQQLRALGISSDADLEAAEFAAKAAEFDMHGWEALVESSQAEIHRFEIELDQMRIHAPFAGVVVRRYVREGQTVSKSDKCFRLSQLSPLLVQFPVPESSARRVERGTVVELSLVGDPKRVVSARVVKISPTVDPASDSYDVTAQLTGPGISDLRPGMAVRVLWPGTPTAAKTKP
jgi:macrolide-specific efflux system membrane fusion protein